MPRGRTDSRTAFMTDTLPSNRKFGFLFVVVFGTAGRILLVARRHRVALPGRRFRRRFCWRHSLRLACSPRLIGPGWRSRCCCTK